MAIEQLWHTYIYIYIYSRRLWKTTPVWTYTCLLFLVEQAIRKLRVAASYLNHMPYAHRRHQLNDISWMHFHNVTNTFHEFINSSRRRRAPAERQHHEFSTGLMAFGDRSITVHQNSTLLNFKKWNWNPFKFGFRVSTVLRVRPCREGFGSTCFFA